MTEDCTNDNILKGIIRQAKDNPIYKDIYANVRETDNIFQIPFLEEQHLQMIDTNDVSKFTEASCVHFTSGTTAEPKAFYRKQEEITYITDYIKELCKIENIAGGERVAVLLGQSFWGAGYYTTEGHVKAGNIVTAIDTGLTIESIVQLLQSFKPTVISSTPSFLASLKGKISNLNLKILETTGELLDNQTRRDLETSFKTKIFDAYGLTEGVIGTECSEHDGYHFLPSKLYLEIINPKTEELLKEDTWGELVMTVLCDSIMPIIRYKTKDICKISTALCPCGYQSPRIWIKGRKEKFVSLYEGAKVAYTAISKTLEEIYGSAMTFSLEIKNNDKMSMMYINLINADPVKDEFAKAKIASLNYETLYLTSAGKLHIILFHGEFK